MVNANELRIGNLLYFNANLFEGQKNKIVEIETINKDFVTDTINKNTVIGGYENYQPILLDEEWLKKFGFNYFKHESPLNAKLYADETWDFCVLKEDGAYFYAEQENEDSLYFTVKWIRYVHQLQNLYFALTGEEIKLIIE